MAKSKVKAEAKAEKGVSKRTFNEFNPCRPMARGRNSERVFWVDELVQANGRHYKDIFETAAKKWAKAENKRDGSDIDENIDLYKNNIPGTPSDTKRMLETLIPMVAKKFGRTLSYEFDEDGNITVEVGAATKTKKSKTEAKSTKKSSKKAAVKAADEDEDEEDEDEDEDDEDED
jgi:hypothetical protein